MGDDPVELAWSLQRGHLWTILSNWDIPNGLWLLLNGNRNDTMMGTRNCYKLETRNSWILFEEAGQCNQYSHKDTPNRYINTMRLPFCKCNVILTPYVCWVLCFLRSSQEYPLCSMICYPRAPSHCPNQCWILTSVVSLIWWQFHRKFSINVSLIRVQT